MPAGSIVRSFAVGTVGDSDVRDIERIGGNTPSLRWFPAGSWNVRSRSGTRTVADTLSICFLYDDVEPATVLERIAEAIEADGLPDIEAEGPRERYGVVDLSLIDTGDEGSVGADLEAVAPGDREWLTPTLPAVEMILTRDNLEIGDTERQEQRLVDVVQTIYRATESPPRYVYGFDPYHAEGVGERLSLPVTVDGLDEGHVQDVTWLMLFPPDFADAVGREKLSSAPAWRVEEFDDGAILLLAVSDPTDPNGVDYSALREHFGVEDPGPRR